jgi:AcrR family transcriptional regulator
VARWEPDSRGRLLQAALELFADGGFEATTTAQLAERAGLTKATVFRLFSDKREILFQGQGASVRTARLALADAPDSTGPVEAVRIALRALSDAHVPEQQEIGRRIDAILETSEDLQERAAAKRATIALALQEGLVAQGAAPLLAGPLADLGVRAYYDGFAAWTHAAADADLGAAVLARFNALVAALSSALDADASRAIS